MKRGYIARMSLIMKKVNGLFYFKTQSGTIIVVIFHVLKKSRVAVVDTFQRNPSAVSIINIAFMVKVMKYIFFGDDHVIFCFVLKWRQQSRFFKDSRSSPSCIFLQEDWTGDSFYNRYFLLVNVTNVWSFDMKKKKIWGKCRTETYPAESSLVVWQVQ